MQGTTAEPIPSTLDRIRDQDFGYHEARHLLWRAGFGGTPRQIETLASWGPEKAVDHLIEVERVPYDKPDPNEFDPDIMRPPTAAEQAEAQMARRQRDEDSLARLRLLRQQRQRQDRRQMADIQRWWLERMIETPRPLEEKMTLFWHGLFATSYRTIENSYHMYQQNQFYRSHAIGSYKDLLFGLIRDPAMLAYLDNDDSRVGHPNENLAREIMELFSLGVGNYSERDIKEGARALTGYTFVDDEFSFNEKNHDKGSKSILGTRGNLNGEGFVGAILRQKACAEYIAARLYDEFALHMHALAPEDEPAVRRVTARLAGELRDADYNVRPVLRTLFLSKHFYHPRVVNNRIKSPAELVIGAVRSLNTPVRDMGVLLQAMDLMGQSLFYPPSVKGWLGGRTWINTSTIFVRQNLMNFLLTGKLPVGYDSAAREEKYDPTALLEPLAETDPAAARDPARVVDYLLRFTLGHPQEQAQGVLTEFVADHGNTIKPDVITGMLLLVAAMPEYQLC
ncbi:MAG: DUF1800 domain-containing protein [Phycisphaeraceae bacterium]|nr:MAG: DUF1800 domain-containing protein [Phycisphaeraceae bacterium]